MRHVLSAIVQNQPGVLAHISGMLASRGFNIDSLAVGETEVADLSRITFVVHGDDGDLEQVRKQLDKVVTCVRVMDISSEDYVERDLMIIKVKATSGQRVELSLLVEMFRGRVVDITHDTLMIEVSGQEGKIEAFIELMRPYGILGTGAHGTNRFGTRYADPGGKTVSIPDKIELPTRRLDPKQVELLRSLKTGQRISVIQMVRVGSKSWTTEALGTFRSINYLATGVTTERVPEDDLIVPMVHFTKDNGELSSIAIDENSQIKLA